MSEMTVISQMKARLTDLYNTDFGFPLGENVVYPAFHTNGLPKAFLSITGSKWLGDLYLNCNGLSFPDVHVGYFIKPIERVMSFDLSSEPNVVLLHREFGVLPFGSTGGGDLFVISCDSGNVLLLPPNLISNGYYDGRNVRVSQVADSVSRFVQRLLEDLSAFIDDDQEHIYISSGK